MKTKLIKGFIDPISLIGLGLLVVTLVVGSIFVNKGGINLNYKEKTGSALYNSCAEVPNNICNTIQGCNLKEITTSQTSTACTIDDCNNNVSGCSSTTQITMAGSCRCSLEGSTAKTPQDCKSSEFLGTCTWIPPVTSKTCSGNKTVTETAKICEGTPCGIKYSACCGGGYPNGTCNSGLTCSNIDGGICKVKVDLPTTQPTPIAETNQTTETTCGNAFEPCCNQGYPNGTCNTGLYCSNLDGGTCRTNVCHAERKCLGNVLQICKDDDSGWKNTNCQYGCSEITKNCKVCNSGDKVCDGDSLKTCNTTGTSWEIQTCSSNQTCDNSLKMCVATTGTCIEPCSNDLDCGDNNYCYKPSLGCPVCKAKGLSCTPGEKRCSSNYAQTCNTQGTSWQSQDCLTFGCNQDTKECNPDPTIISQNDCDTCLLTNSPSECQGACANVGEKIVDDSCTPNTNECFFGNLRTCSSSGTKGLTTCSNGCDEINNVCKPNLLAIGETCGDDPGECTSGHCYAGNQILGGSPFDSIKRCHAQAIETMDEITKDVNTAVAAGGAVLIGAGAVGVVGIPTALIITNFSDDAITIAKCVATGDPEACYWAGLTVSNPIPGMSMFDDVADFAKVSNSFVPVITNFADDALARVTKSKYISGGGQKIIINIKKDADLINYIEDARQFVNDNRTNRKVSRIPLLQQFVTQTFPNYSGADVEKSVAEATKLAQQNIYKQGGGVANLGEFIACQAAVCREQALILHTVLADVGKSTEVVTGYLPAGKHAWVEYVDSVTGQRMVADPVWDFVLPINAAYATYGGVSGTQKKVFVKP